ncbi:DUF1330 domain-containing protein [Fodinibius sp.]|uniref:DUF1330 domain-containing protein n=1 Tax=Fodinibius sp. TaxID=1872440 RepID=UPI002ACD33DF|nr:DUF1330 domain-containing protein [Fodinibius sp.]MDZ7660077.1 DUF1330 domain-containing protein [Fodinibius sp.]
MTSEIHDRDRHQRYEEGFMDIFSKYQGTLLAVDEAPTVLEGEWPWTRTVLLEFPDENSLRAWYDSEEYQALAQHRFAGSQASIAMVKGLE